MATAGAGLVLGTAALGGLWVSRVALAKGLVMFCFGIGVLAYAGWRAVLGVPPDPMTMGVVGLAALGVNFGVALLLFRFREGDANMRSVWLCTRNDVIANIAVIAAALGVFGTGSLWPDFAVAAVLAALVERVVNVVKLDKALVNEAPLTKLPEEKVAVKLVLRAVC